MAERLLLEKQLDFNSHTIMGDSDNLSGCHHNLTGVREFEGHGYLMTDLQVPIGFKKNTRGAHILNRCRE